MCIHACLIRRSLGGHKWGFVRMSKTNKCPPSVKAYPSTLVCVLKEERTGLTVPEHRMTLTFNMQQKHFFLSLMWITCLSDALSSLWTCKQNDGIINVQSFDSPLKSDFLKLVLCSLAGVYSLFNLYSLTLTTRQKYCDSDDRHI